MTKTIQNNNTFIPAKITLKGGKDLYGFIMGLSETGKNMNWSFILHQHYPEFRSTGNKNLVEQITTSAVASIDTCLK